MPRLERVGTLTFGLVVGMIVVLAGWSARTAVISGSPSPTGDTKTVTATDGDDGRTFTLRGP
ncbi:MAG: hypothetical protein NVSMB4_09430 [Acidimicrobiales bacterium]